MNVKVRWLYVKRCSQQKEKKRGRKENECESVEIKLKARRPEGRIVSR